MGNDKGDEVLSFKLHNHILVEMDEHHRIYVCEHGLIHLVWGDDVLPYCPSDLIGVLYQLCSQKRERKMRDELYEMQDDGDMPYLQYGSFRLSLTPEELHCLQAMVQKALERLGALRQAANRSNLTDPALERGK
jgi:hypothetical protein